MLRAPLRSQTVYKRVAARVRFAIALRAFASRASRISKSGNAGGKRQRSVLGIIKPARLKDVDISGSRHQRKMAGGSYQRKYGSIRLS